MSITLTNPPTDDGLFDILGKAFFALDTLNTAVETTVPGKVDDYLNHFQNISLPGTEIEFQQATDGTTSAVESWKSSSESFAGAVINFCGELVIQFAQEDSNEPYENLDDSLLFLVNQMRDEGSRVDPNVIGFTLATDSDNVGDAAICYTELRGDGQATENTYAEVIQIEVIDDSSNVQPTIDWSTEEGTSLLRSDFPKGSDIVSFQFAANDPANTLLSNGNFEDTTIPDVPDDWVIYVGTPGGTIKVSSPAQQTIIISGSPTGGSYVLYYENADGIRRATEPMAYNASASVIQTQLREIPDLELATVTSSGTSPNFTHTVVFDGLAGTVALLTSTDEFTGGITPAIAHATTIVGEVGAYKGKALRLDSNGVEETDIYHPLFLESETVYFCHFRIRRTTSPDESSSSSSQSSSSSSSTSSSSSSSVTSSSSSSSSSSSVSSSSSPSSATESSSSQSTSSSSRSETSSSSSSQSSTSAGTSSNSSVTSSSSSQSSSSSSSSTSSSSSSFSSASSSSSSSSSESGSSSSSSASAEEIRFEITDGIAGNTTVDKSGNDNQLRIDASTISTDTHDSQFFTFRIKREITQPVYLRIYMNNPVTLGDSIYIDEVSVVAGVELYPGGPWVAAFSGATPAVSEDKWTLTVTNNRGGEFQTWFHRAFDMSNRGLLLPVSGAGTYVPDTLIS